MRGLPKMPSRRRTPSGEKRPNRWGLLRHLRQRLGMVRGRVQPDLLQGTARGRPHRPGQPRRRRQAGDQWRQFRNRAPIWRARRSASGSGRAIPMRVSRPTFGFRAVRRVTPEELAARKSGRERATTSPASRRVQRHNALPHLAIPGLYAGRAAGVLRAAQDALLDSVAAGWLHTSSTAGGIRSTCCWSPTPPRWITCSSR